MKTLPFLLLALAALCLLLPPVAPLAWAQDGDGCGCGDGCTEIDTSKSDGGDEDEEEEQRKKNAGLAGGGKGSKDDPGAPTVKMSLQQKINKAIKTGVQWLKKRQAKDGSYPPVTANRDYKTKKDIGKRYRDELGPSAWAIYTLAKCGVKRTDPVIKKGMKFLMDQTKFMWDELGAAGNVPFGGRKTLQKPSRKSPRTVTTYETAAIIMMIEAVYTKSAKLTGKHRKRRLQTDNPLKPPARSKIPKQVWKYMHNRVLFLTTGRRGGGRKGRTIKGLQCTSGPNKGGWRYGPGNDADLSATQFALLALRAASQAGYPVEKTAPDVWRSAASYVMNCQRPSGGFTYQRQGGAVNGSMTACGVGCLIIAKEQMALAGQPVPDWLEVSLKKGMDWLDQNFHANNQGGGRHHYYYLYGIERVGDLTGRKEFNKKDWYVRGARILVGAQDPSGKWGSGEPFPPRDVNSTTLALLFLKRATPPTITSTER